MEDRYRVPVADADRIRAGLAIQIVALATGVPAERMRRRVRLAGQACQARRLAIYLAYITFGWPIERVSHAFGLHRATVAAACRWVEDERDRSTLDALLDRLEHCVREALALPACELPA